MREKDPFRDLLESLREGNLDLQDERQGNAGGAGGSDVGVPNRQGNPRMFLWLLIPLLILTFFNRGLGFYTDWLWYESLDLDGVLFTRVGAAVSLFVAGALLFWLFLAGNVLLARRLEPTGLTDSPFSQIAAAIGLRMTPIILIIGALFALFMGAAASTNWEELLLYFNQSDLGLADPIFGRDVSFFIFSLPIWQSARNWAMTTTVITLIATALVTGIGWRSWNTSAAVRAHLSGLGALLLLLIAWQYRLDAFHLVYSNRGAVFGGGFTDVTAQLPAYNILTAVTLLTAILLIANVFLRRAWRAIVVVLVVWVAAAFLAGNLYPGFVQRFQVEPNEFERERPYIEQNIRFTRHAFGLNDIENLDYDASGLLTTEGLMAQPETVRNIRLWDYRPLLQTYNQVQALRQYYEFTDIDIDRYEINGEVRQVMLSARELAPERLSDQAQTWVNRKLVYTHGYGVAASPVAEITPDGLPRFLLKDLPPQGMIPLVQPQIYFGERTNDYVIVKTNTPEFDYPSGDGNVFTTFEAETGVGIGSYWTRLAFSLRFADVNILLSDAIRPDSRLLWRRNIVERVREVAPFLAYDSDPYIVIGDDGKLYWFIDAYTSSNLFPYSEPVNNRINYIRNPIKVVINAYSGDMKFYLIEPDEPIAAAYARIFPALFTPYTEMPDGLRAHIRYPNDLFSIQASVYRTYQMTDLNEFYNKEDVWAWPEEIFDNQSRLMEPYYVLMQLPNSPDLDFIQILPFTPANRENMIAWLAAHNDPHKYGQKLVYRFGKDSLIYGPKQVEARIDQNPIISSQLSLWNQQGSQVIRGNLLVIPIGESLLYVEPLYLQAATGKIPELKRVILATADKVIMAENLGLALVQLFGRDVLEDARLAELAAGIEVSQTPATSGDSTAVEPTAATSVDQLILEANGRFESAQAALRAGDWARYGAEMEALQQVIARLVEVSGVSLPAAEEEPASESSTAGS